MKASLAFVSGLRLLPLRPPTPTSSSIRGQGLFRLATGTFTSSGTGACSPHDPNATLTQPPRRIPFSLEILKLRQRVMWPNQPIEYSGVEGDEDESTLHFGVFSSLSTTTTTTTTTSSRLEPMKENLVSVVSVWINPDGTEAQFRKFCTDTIVQGQGIGTSLLTYTFQELMNTFSVPPTSKEEEEDRSDEAVVDDSTTKNTNTSLYLRRIWCNARVEQCGFYAKPPFHMTPIENSEFVKGGRDYRLMERVLVEEETNTTSLDNGNGAE